VCVNNRICEWNLLVGLLLVNFLLGSVLQTKLAITVNCLTARSILRISCHLSLANAVITIEIRLRYDYDATIYDPTTTYRAHLLLFDASKKMNMSVFRRSRVVVVSQSNRTHIVISMTFLVD